jgi:hypothetical protein
MKAILKKTGEIINVSCLGKNVTPPYWDKKGVGYMVDELTFFNSDPNKKYEFQVNLHFGEKTMSACGLAHVFQARNLIGLLRKIQKELGLKSEQIILTFQPE